MSIPLSSKQHREWLVGTAACILLTSALSAQSCADRHFVQPDTQKVERSKLAALLSSRLGISLITELPISSTSSVTDITLPKGDLTLADVASLMNTEHLVSCDMDQEIAHLYTEGALNSSENALNHLFKRFDIPSNADLFALDFRTRIEREAFDPKIADTMTGPSGGGVPSDAYLFPLKQETVKDKTARDIFLRAASQVLFSLSIEVPENGTSPSVSKGMRLSVTRK